jgi:hypothetical protein
MRRLIEKYGWDFLAVLALALISTGLAWWLEPGIGLVAAGTGLMAFALAGASGSAK